MSDLSSVLPQSSFLWGTATSAHQVEGSNTANDWWAWEEQGKVPHRSGLACDHYRRFSEDIDLITRLGHNAHRFSLEWSRLEPEEGRWNEEAFRHYETVLQELCARKIEPIVTLHHFTNPRWFNEKGGWIDPAANRFFLRYVRRAAERFSPHVRFWITINEPLIYLYHGFFAGLWPPGYRSLQDSMAAFRNLLNGHMDAYRLLHYHYETASKKTVWVSVAKHMSSYVPCRNDSLLDRTAVFFRNWFFNDGFVDAAQTGFLFFPGMFCELLPQSRTLDFLGINYYSQDHIRFDGFAGDRLIGKACEKRHHKGDVRELNQMGWEVSPDGFYRILMRAGRHQLPILITENGICTEDDTQRVRFIQDHLSALQRARREGIPIFGYLYWSLLDNFEWAHGFGPRFGIVRIDPPDLERKILPSAQVLSESCRKLICGLSS